MESWNRGKEHPFCFHRQRHPALGTASGPSPLRHRNPTGNVPLVLKNAHPFAPLDFWAFGHQQAQPLSPARGLSSSLRLPNRHSRPKARTDPGV